MAGSSIAHKFEFARLIESIPDGVSSITGTSIDMSGWDGAVFLFAIGTSAGNVAFTVDQSDDDGDSDPFLRIDPSLQQQLAPGGRVGIVEIHRPTKRFLRPQIIRVLGSCEIDSVIAFKYGGQKTPAVNPADSVDGYTVVSA